jgi:tetratricopeptide (TPR) repeat protein
LAKLSVDQALLKAKSYAKKGDIEEAQKLYQAVLQAFPKNKRAQHGLALLNKSKQSTPAQTPPQEIINRLVNLYNQGELLDVVGQAQSLTEQYPEAFIIWNILGAAASQIGLLDKAIAAFQRVIAIKPDYAEAYNNMGNTLKDQGRLDEAVASFNKALSLKPDYVEAYSNMGIALEEQGKLEEAIASYNKALSLMPDYVEAYNNMGNALKDQGKLEEAIASYEKAVSLKPDYAEAYNNMGSALQDQGKLDEAVVAFNKALSVKPDYAEAYHKLFFPYLLQGNLDKGFRLSEWRMKKDKPTVRLPRTGFIWDGKTSLKGKSFFIYEEQGLGDIIQFCRCLPLLEQKGAKVTFKLKSKLHKLLKTLESDAFITDQLPNEEKIDFEAPLMSLPHLFGTDLDTIPSTNPYLYADHEKTKTWGERLRGDKFKIGICWQGSKAKVDIGRSFPLSLFEGISKTPNVELISLHKGEGESQIAGISFDLTTLGADLDIGDDAFLDTAAVMMNCDLIITSDTAVAHLAGALGCQTWVALKHIPDWRWLLNRSDSPWYPSMTLYRQKISGDWGCVFDAINRDVNILLDQRG